MILPQLIVYTVLTLAALATSLCIGGFASSGGVNWGFAVCAWAVAVAWSARIESQRNPVALAKFAVAVGAPIALVFTVAATLARPRLVTLIAAAGGAIAVVLTAVGYLIWRYTSPDPIANVLLGEFRRGDTVEHGDVQMAARWEDATDCLHVWLQNACDGPRSVALTLEPAVPFSAPVPQLPVIALRPLEVGTLRIPLAQAVADRSMRVGIVPAISGSDGRRLRLWEAPTYCARVPWWLTLLSLALGHLHFGGGWSVRVGPARRSSQLAAPAWQSVWTP